MSKVRHLEIFIFFAQLTSVLTYIMACKIFYNLKKVACKYYDLEYDDKDPFLALLVKENEDFLASDSFFMQT